MGFVLIDHVFGLCAQPLVLRFVAADNIWLSPQYQRETLVISVAVYRNDEMMQRLSRAVERICLKHGGRPHWGKCNSHPSLVMCPVLLPLFVLPLDGSHARRSGRLRSSLPEVE